MAQSTLYFVHQQRNWVNEMTYEEFKAAYANNFKLMMSYKPNECGSSYYSEKLADLSDAYPDFETRMEAELEAA